MTKLKLRFTNGQEISIENGYIDEEKRVVKKTIPTEENQGFVYDYYPFENLIGIFYQGEEEDSLNI